MDRDSLNLLQSATRLYLASKGWIYQETPHGADVVFVDTASNEGRRFLDSFAGAARVVHVCEQDDVGVAGNAIPKPLRYRNVLKILTGLFHDRDVPRADHGQVLLEVLEQRLARGRPFLLTLENSPLQVEPSTGFFYAPGDWSPSAQHFKVAAGQFSARDLPCVDTAGKRRGRIESLLFNAALNAAPRMDRDFTCRSWRLVRWPDLGEINAPPSLARLCAVLHRQPATRAQLVDTTGLAAEDVDAFLLAAYTAGLLTQEAPVVDPRPRVHADEDTGLYAAIRARLFG